MPVKEERPKKKQEQKGVGTSGFLADEHRRQPLKYGVRHFSALAVVVKYVWVSNYLFEVC